MLKPGIYKLTQDVTNPNPDRRLRRDWRGLPVWSSGQEFLVEESNSQSARESGESHTAIALVGSSPRDHAIGPGYEEQYAALESALVLCDGSDEALLAALGVQDGFAAWLLTSGKLDRDTLRALWTEYQTDEPQLTSDGYRIDRLVAECVVPRMLNQEEKTP